MRLAIPGLTARLRDQSTLVTSSTVLAAVASQQFARSELDQGHLSWRRPGVYSLEAWLGNCWLEARYAIPDLPSLLSPSQELLLWEQVIANSGAQLFDISATARLSREALRLAIEWEVPLDDEGWHTHEDALQFHRWQAAFRKQCQSHGWMTRNEALRLLPEWIDSGVCAKESLLFAGFHNPSPSLQAVFRVAGTLLAEERSPVPSHPCPVRMCDDSRGQIEAASRWARFQLEKYPGRSIGVFVPNLPDHRSEIERIFRTIFYPASGLRFVSERVQTAVSNDQPAFHINRAQSLYENPIVASALLLLELANPRIETTAATAILRSPFISGAEEERNNRALADLALRRLRGVDVSLRDLEYASRSCPLLTQRWTRIREVLDAKPKKAELSAWSRFFGDLVQAAGWPGDIELTAAEQQVVEGWKDSLSSLASLGLVSPPASCETALTRLRQILGAGGIQSGDWYSPVQILDATDAPGLEFDAAFLVGLSEETWPPPLRSSPLIPLQLQREYSLPNSTPEALQQERIRLTSGLFHSSARIWGTFKERLSPLVANFAQVSEDELPRWNGNAPIESFPAVMLQAIEDSQAPPVDVSRGASGGTGIIKSQSLCAFRAFAEYRLRSQLPEDSCFGFDARDRGGFLHKALQFVWQELKDSETLKKYPETSLRMLVHDSVQRAVSGVEDDEFHAQTSQVERERLETLLMQWLIDVEKNRKLPFSVEQVEDELQFNLAGLPLRLRLDRIDRLRDGGLLLIDYKSGTTTKKKLETNRPPEPQLLVYAAAKSPRVEGLLFGEVRQPQPRLVGKTRDRHVAGGSTEVMGNQWDDFIACAEQHVTNLAAAFLRGEAPVRPLKGACDYCSSKALCRINEARPDAEEEA